MVFWVIAHRWPPRKSRGFLFFVFLTGIPPHLGALLAIYGSDLLAGVAYGLLTLPVVLIGTFVGLQLGNKLSRDRLRRCSYAVLTLVAITAITEPFVLGSDATAENHGRLSEALDPR